MSAWIVTKAHIDLLVEALFKYEVVLQADLAHVSPTEIGKLLWRENHRSINYRYEERKRTPRYSHSSATICYTWEYRWPAQPLQVTLGTVREVVRQPYVVLKQAGCYRYQSCERPDWERSTARGLITRLGESVCKSLGMDEDAATDSPAYHAAPWGID